MTDINSFREKLQSLIAKFEKDKTHYVSKGYPEAQVRTGKNICMVNKRGLFRSPH